VLEPILTNLFKKELELMKRRNRNMPKIRHIMELIEAEQPLPEHCHPHPLHGIYAGKWECHVENDWLLVYKVRQGAGTVTFHRTGTHADLFS
jgi:mRNA interferase YafQ